MTTLTKPIALTELSLPALLKAIQPAALAVEQADAELATARTEYKRLITDADATRNQAIATAKAARDVAERVYQDTVRDVIAVHEAVLHDAKEQIGQAMERHADRCAVLDPLFQEVQSRAQQIRGMATGR